MKYGMKDRIKFLWSCTKGSRLSLFIIYIFSLVDSFSDTVRNIVFALAVSALVGGKSFNEVLKNIWHSDNCSIIICIYKYDLLQILV